MMMVTVMMINNNLVGGFDSTPLKNDGVSSSVGMMIHSQLFLEKINHVPNHQPGFHGVLHGIFIEPARPFFLMVQ
jgi:hypothetical protein